VDELISTIKLIKSTDFKVEDVNIDLHKRVAAAIAKGHFTSHNMRESEDTAALQYPYRRNHPLLQFLPLKLAEWITNNLADELRMRPASVDGWSSAQLNHILTSCLVSDRRGNNLHTFHTVEFEESDLYRGVMRARCYPFDMEEHRFRGKNIKVLRLHVHQCT
jgi:hypothetical protein